MSAQESGSGSQPLYSQGESAAFGSGSGGEIGGPSANDHRPSRLLVVLSGPSGVGKDAVVSALRALGRPWHFAITMTTRPIRAGEREGMEYHFVAPDRFLNMRDAGELLESAEVYGNWYGVPKQQVRDAMGQGRDVLVKVDVQGAATIRKLAPDAVSIFLAPADVDELRRRLEHRASETGLVLEKRLQAAWEEMEHLPRFDYHVINKDGCLDEAVRNIDAIVRAEKCRSVPRKVVL